MLDGGNCRTANIAHAARCKIHGDIYYCNTGEEVRKNPSNTGMMPKTDQITMNLQHTYTGTNMNLTRILSIDIKWKSTSKA